MLSIACNCGSCGSSSGGGSGVFSEGRGGIVILVVVMGRGGGGGGGLGSLFMEEFYNMGITTSGCPMQWCVTCRGFQFKIGA